MAVTVTPSGSDLFVTLSASGDTATPQNIIAAGYATLIGNKTIQFTTAYKVKLQIATGATYDDTEWVYELPSGASLRMNETYGCGTWRSGWVLQGSTYVKAKGHTVNYNNFDGSNNLGGRTIFYNSGAPTGYPTSKPTIHWNDTGWYEASGTNAAAIPDLRYGQWSPTGMTSGRLVFDYQGDTAGANSGFGGSFGTIESVLLNRCIGGVGTGFDTTSLVSIGKFEYFSLPTGNTTGSNPDIKMAFPNNLPFSGFAPVFYRDANTTFIGANTTQTEILDDYILPTNYPLIANSRNYATNTRTYRRTVSLSFKDSATASALTDVTTYITSGSNVLVNAVQPGDFSQKLNTVFVSWVGRSPAVGSYIAPLTSTDTQVQTAQLRKNGFVSQSFTYNLTNGAYSRELALIADPAYGSVTPAQAAALTGISVDYPNKVVNGSASRNLDQVYAFGQNSQALSANSAQADFQSSPGGVYRLLNTWKLNWTAGALTMGTYNTRFISSTQWKFGNTASLTLDKDDVTWTPAARGDTFQFESGSTFNITNGSTLTFSPTAALGYGTGTTSEFRSGSTLNMSDSALVVNAPAAGSGTYFSNTEAGATWNITNSVWTFNAPGNGTQPQLAIHAYFLPASNINGLTINGTSTNVVWQMGFTSNNSKMVGFKFGGSIFGNGTSNILMDTYTYTGGHATIPNTFGSFNKWYWVDPVMQSGALFRWLPGPTAAGTGSFYGVIGFRPNIRTEKTAYAPKMRITPSAMAARYPSKIIQTTEESAVSLSQFFRDPTFMSASDGFLPFVDSLDDKTVINTIDWTLNFRQPGWIDQTKVFTAATAKAGLVIYNASGAADPNYVNAATAAADAALITVSTTTKTIAPVSGALEWSPQRLYNALKNWWATFASNTDFLAATGNSVLDLGDYSTAASLSFTKPASGDALTGVRTTGTISAPTNEIPVKDAGGVSSIVEVRGIKAGASYIVTNHATKATIIFGVNNTGQAQDYTVYFPTGSAGTQIYVARKLHTDQLDFAVLTLEEGQMFVGFNDIPDEGVTQTNKDAVLAYTSLETTSKLYDYISAFQTTEAGLKLGSIVTRAGPILQFGNYSGVVNQSAASVFGINGNTITIKANGLAKTSRYTTIVATPPATWTANTNEVLDLDIEDANGDSSVTIQAGSVSTFEIWKLADEAAEDQYATGTLLDTVGPGKFRFLHADGYKLVIRDQITNYRVSVEMEKGVYTAELFFGAQVQLAQSALVEVIKNDVDLLKVLTQAIQGANFLSSMHSLAALGDKVNALPTNSEIDALTAKVEALPQAGDVMDANIVKVNGVAVDGTGTEADPWGPV